jgi:hypothetical protein
MMPQESSKAALKRTHSRRWREFEQDSKSANDLECVRFSAAFRGTEAQ